MINKILELIIEKPLSISVLAKKLNKTPKQIKSSIEKHRALQWEFLQDYEYSTSELDTVASRYIRHRDTFCVTCGKNLEYNKRQCGHFLSRRFFGTRYDERNMNTQCYYCNISLQGNQYRHGQATKNMWGDDIIDILESLRNKKLTHEAKKTYYKYYTDKLKEVEKLDIEEVDFSDLDFL